MKKKRSTERNEPEQNKSERFVVNDEDISAVIEATDIPLTIQLNWRDVSFVDKNDVLGPCNNDWRDKPLHPRERIVYYLGKSEVRLGAPVYYADSEIGAVISERNSQNREPFAGAIHPRSNKVQGPAWISIVIPNTLKG